MASLSALSRPWRTWARRSEGRGNLVRRTMELRQLGVKAQKELPEELLEKAMDEN